jgi:phage-related protein
VNNEDTTVDSDTTFKLGGLGDLWGFQTQDITNLEDWELQLTVNNIILEDVANINFGPITLIIYVEKLETQLINIKVNGEDLSYYGAFIEDVDIPSGLETDTGFLTIDGTDTNDAYRQNIREKEIELKFSIGECDLGTSTDMLRQITKLLVNDKDTYNRPIPNRIEFSHYPDIYFEYIMNDAMSITSELSSYDVTAKLVVPAGTAYSKEITTTNITGNVQGLAAISPVVSFKPQGEVIEIKELVSNQRFSMGYSGDWQSKIVELDCANRIAWLKSNEDDTEAIDISKYVDFNSDWFALKGEYSFSGTNCTIRRVEYAERW